MKKLLLALTVGVTAGLVMAQDMVTADQQSDVSVSADVGLYSAYVWRGQVINDAPVVQPSLTVSKGPFSLNFWANYNLDGKGGQKDTSTSEFDFTFAYTLPVNTDDFSIDVGLVHYTFPNSVVGAPETDEIFISSTFYHIILTPVVSLYYDVNEANGFYGSLALSQGFELSDALSVEVGASAGLGNNKYNEYYFGPTSSSGMNDYNVYVSASYALSEDLTLGALLQYTYLDGAMQGSGTYLADDLVWGGLSLSYNF